MASQSFSTTFGTTIAKKILMALTGLFLVVFVIIHMVGNLQFVFGTAEAFNTYSHTLTVTLRPIVNTIRFFLALAFLLHIWNGISIALDNSRARPVKYRKTGSAGDPSKKTLSSTTMIYTGLVLLVFLVIHLKTFALGSHHTVMVNGVAMTDLYRAVEEVFHSPIYAYGYIFAMLLLGFHLRHGFWSAFQSLGTNHPKYSGIIYTIGIIIAVVVAFGFLSVPVKVQFMQ